VVDGIYRALKASAEGQFGGTNAALLAIRLLDLTMAQLHDLGAGSNKLADISNRLFAGERRAHLFGVAALSEAMDAAGATFSNRGTALLFRREAHRLSRDPRLALFERR
jgi:hypothetical protein